MKNISLKLNLNVLKLVALISLTIDHTTKIIWDSPDSFKTELGRIAMPLFIFLLVVNLLYNTKAPTRYLKRLWIFALISQIPYGLAFEQIYLLNVFITLGLIGLILHYSLPLLQKNAWHFYWITSSLGSLTVTIRYFEIPFFFDYGFPAIFLAISLATFLIHRTIDFALFSLLGCYLLNNSLVSFVAVFAYLPLIFFLAIRVPWRLSVIKQYKYFFYSYYPLHLLILVGIKFLLEWSF